MEAKGEPQRRVAGPDENVRFASAAELRIGRRRADRVIAADPGTKRAADMAATAARSDLPVLVCGPQGSGRSFFARAIHAWSPRAAAAFEAFPCDSLTPTLQARGLFGFAAEAAASFGGSHRGVLERVGGGTVVLDGADALAPGIHVRLVHALSERRFRREGEAQDLPLEARIVATVERLPEEKPFGGLSFHEIGLAPLSERREEILPLASHFLGVYAREAGVSPVGFTRDARAALLEEVWHGNVRELRERIRQAVYLAEAGAITPEALLLAPGDAEIPSFREAKRAFETRYVKSLLRRCDGNVSRAARLARKDRKDFYDVIRRTGVRPSDFRPRT